MEIIMSNELNFPIKYKYTKVIPGDYVAGKIPSAKYMYAGASGNIIKVLSDTSEVTDASYMFYYCSAPVISDFDTSLVTSMQYMFSYCNYLTAIPNIDTSNAANMEGMFQTCYELTYIPPLITSKATDMSSMFYSCKKLTSIPPIITSNATDTSSMFSGCEKLESIPELDFGKVTNLYSIFYKCDSLTDLGGFKDLGKQNSVSGTSSSFLSYTPNITHQSLMNVINKLYDRKANGMSTMTLNLGSTNLAKLTDEEKAIAINKGWNLS